MMRIFKILKLEKIRETQEFNEHLKLVLAESNFYRTKTCKNGLELHKSVLSILKQSRHVHMASTIHAHIKHTIIATIFGFFEIWAPNSTCAFNVFDVYAHFQDITLWAANSILSVDFWKLKTYWTRFFTEKHLPNMGAEIRKMFEIFQKKSSANAKFLIKNYWSMEFLVLNFCNEKMPLIIEPKQDWKILSNYWNLASYMQPKFSGQK